MKMANESSVNVSPIVIILFWPPHVLRARGHCDRCGPLASSMPVRMPLIMDLKNPAMRQRHWDQLTSEINKEFDPKGADFTLEKVFTLGLHLHAGVEDLLLVGVVLVRRTIE